MNEIIELKRNLYVKDVERLLKRQVDSVEVKAIKTAFSRHRSSIETAKLITGSTDRVDRQNDFA